MAKQKDSFLIYYEWEETLQCLKQAQKGDLLDAMFAYEKRGELYAGEDPMVYMAFNFIKGTMDRAKQAYKDTCERNRENGKKGGAPAGNRNAAKSSSGENNPEQPKTTDGLKKQPKQPRTTQNNPNKPNGTDQNGTEGTDQIGLDRNGQDRDGQAAHDGAEDELSLLCQAMEGFGISVSDTGRRELEPYLKAMGYEIVAKAIAKARDKQAESVGYVIGILRNWREQGKGGRTAAVPPNWMQRPPHKLTDAEEQELDAQMQREMEEMARAMAQMQGAMPD